MHLVFLKIILRKTNNETLNILLIQPNLYESLVEFDVLRNLEIYEKLTLEALTNSPKVDLIIWLKAHYQLI